MIIPSREELEIRNVIDGYIQYGKELDDYGKIQFIIEKSIEIVDEFSRYSHDGICPIIDKDSHAVLYLLSHPPRQLFIDGNLVHPSERVPPEDPRYPLLMKLVGFIGLCEYFSLDTYYKDDDFCKIIGLRFIADSISVATTILLKFYLDWKLND